jgi:D-tyrosyl-tRNA(Tyr) deacylase
MADKILGLRLLDDAGAMWSTSVLEASAEILLVSNFTLYGDVSKGRRPSWSHAADPDSARSLFETVAQHLVAKGAKLSTAFFGEEMEISAVNYGPTNLLVEF